MSELISIIKPTYNCGKFIGETIELRAKEGKEKGIQHILITCFLTFNLHKSPVRQVLTLFKDEETDLVMQLAQGQRAAKWQSSGGNHKV